MEKASYSVIALLTSTAFAIGSSAVAQTAPLELEEVVVTGSRVITNGNDSPNPVTIVTTEELAATHPTTVFEALLDLPVFAGSRGASVAPQGAGGNNQNTGALNLRGLGLTRTLVLYDGHRVPATNQDGLVDVNMIPQMLLQRVDVVTGGASAVYGSDAVTGVVNFITDRNFNGIKVNAQGGISEQGDDKQYQVGIAGGVDLFGGRGHVMGSVQVYDDAGLLHRDRAFGRTQIALQGNGTTLPYFLAENSRIGAYSFGGKIIGPATNPLNNYQFATNGVLTPFQNGLNGTAAGLASTAQIGGDGAYQNSASMKAQQDMQQGYGRFDFDLTDDTHFFLTASATKGHSLALNNQNRIPSVVLSVNNAFLSSAYQAQMRAALGANGTFTFGKMWTEDMYPPTDAVFDTRNLYVNTGLEGKLGEGYKWEASYTHGVAKSDSTIRSSRDNARLFAALDAVLVTAANVGSSGLAIGSIACQVSLTANASLFPGCVPLNVFGPTAESQAAINYIIHPTQFFGRTTMDDVSGSITGAPFSTWAGPVNMAASAEWRRHGYSLVSYSPTPDVDPANCTGLSTFNSCAGLAKYQPSANPSRSPVHMDVSEAALEADMPIIEDMRLVQSADINAAVRYARYSINGSPVASIPATTKHFNATTWKLGLDVHFNEELTLRATRSRDIRAPNLNDLFLPGGIQPMTFLDRLIQPQASPQVPLQTGGNPNLVPEVGDTTTLGLVFQATEKLSLAVDAFDIRIKDAITSVAGANALIQDACYASGGSSFYCTLQERPLGYTNTSPANQVTKWYTAPLNIAEQKTYGADFEANYKTQLAGQPFALRGLVTYQPHNRQFQPTVTTTDSAGVTAAVWRATVFAHYSPTEALSIDWLTRWRSRLQNADGKIFAIKPDSRYVKTVAFSNLNLSYRIKSENRGQADVYLNIQNLFNQQPPVAATAGGQTDPGRTDGYAAGDDVVGRYYSVGVRYRL
jgi:outer membrane receptor protein involved in Fe transport